MHVGPDLATMDVARDLLRRQRGLIAAQLALVLDQAMLPVGIDRDESTGAVTDGGPVGVVSIGAAVVVHAVPGVDEMKFSDDVADCPTPTKLPQPNVALSIASAGESE